MFRGHYQPHLPADLGFYDLRVPETRIAQAEMARAYGLEGFCYWHYWFAGKRLLEKPFDEVLRLGSPDLPFCLAWANQSWTGVWHGVPQRILIEQTYPGRRDDEAHFHALLGAFGDDRYITVDGRPLFIVHSPNELPEPERFTDRWREWAVKSGLKGLYFVGLRGRSWVPAQYGFDASVMNNPARILTRLDQRSRIRRILRRLTKNRIRIPTSGPGTYLYRDMVRHALPPLPTAFEHYPCVVPNWDNTPRSGVQGVVSHKSTPELFAIHLREAIGQIAHRGPDKRIIFVKSWNEWAEGNYLEPDQRFGTAYLEAVEHEVVLRR